MNSLRGTPTHSSLLPVIVVSVVVVLVCSGCAAFKRLSVDAPIAEPQTVPDLAYAEARKQLPVNQVVTLPPPPLAVNAEVQHQINTFLKCNGRFLKASLSRRDLYLPVMSQIFTDEGVPHELLSLALIESGYNKEARSHVGAVGMWQFMKSTAKIYGLNVGHEDQRKDPILSTIAAARHLHDLYVLYKDWYLVLAAYNAGPGALSRAMQRSGSNDFWKISKKGKLTKQTRDFIPRFIAAALIAGDPGKFGISMELVRNEGAENGGKEEKLEENSPTGEVYGPSFEEVAFKKEPDIAITSGPRLSDRTGDGYSPVRLEPTSYSGRDRNTP